MLRPVDPRTPRKRPALLIATVGALLLAVTLSGCSLSKDQQPASGSQADSGAGTGFTARTTAGQAIKVPGGRPTVLLFFSVECGTCGPAAKALAQARADDHAAANFVVVDVAAYEPKVTSGGSSTPMAPGGSAIPAMPMAG
ncbi:hypothetical protein GCM10027596_25380 [Nocardioides korecus]